MTPEQFLNMRPFLDAAIAGKAVQYKSADTGNKWVDLPPKFDLPILSQASFRYKPVPKYRPWTNEEVPLGAEVRVRGGDSYNIRSLIVSVCGDLVITAPNVSISLDDLLQQLEYRVPRGGTEWKPCGVLIPNGEQN